MCNYCYDSPMKRVGPNKKSEIWDAGGVALRPARIPNFGDSFSKLDIVKVLAKYLT